MDRGVDGPQRGFGRFGEQKKILNDEAEQLCKVATLAHF